MDEAVDYYRLLGLDETASRAEIEGEIERLQSQALAVNVSGDAAERFEANRRYDQLVRARDVLTNDQTRILYDAERELLTAATASAPGSTSHEDEREANGSPSWSQRARALYDQGKYAESLIACERAVAENPDDADAWQGLSVVREALGDDEGGSDAWERAVHLHDPKVLEEQLLRHELDLESDARALEIVTDRLTQTPSDEALQSECVRLFIKTGRAFDAHAYASKLHAQFPADPRIAGDLAWSCLMSCQAAITETTTGHYITSLAQLIAVSGWTREGLALGDCVNPEVRELLEGFAATANRSAVPVPGPDGGFVQQWQETARIVTATEDVVRWGI